MEQQTNILLLTKTTNLSSRRSRILSGNKNKMFPFCCCSQVVGCILFVAIAFIVLVHSTNSQINADAQPMASAQNQIGSDGEASSPLAVRFRRQAAAAAEAAARQQQLEQDELIKRQLPDLIARANNDKLAERALLKLIIDASLRSGLSNIVSPQQQQVGVSSRRLFPNTDSGWQLIEGNSGGNIIDELNNGNTAGEGSNEASLLQYPNVYGRLARLESNNNNNEQYSNLEGGTNQYNALQQQQQQQQQQTSIDKREYIKPCSFNAISCVRTPFRKL